MTRRIATMAVALLGLLPAAAGAHVEGPERPVVFVASNENCEATFGKMKAAIERIDFELDGEKRQFEDLVCHGVGASRQDVPGAAHAFATWASERYQAQPFDVVAEGPAGLAVRYALGKNGEGNWPELNVEDAVTVGTPHDKLTEPGFDHPDGSEGTDWSVIGSDDDEIARGDSALAMAADHKTTYKDPGLTHQKLLDDASTKKDARIVFQHGDSDPKTSNKAKHVAQRVADDVVYGTDRGPRACGVRRATVRASGAPVCSLGLDPTKKTIVFIPGFGGSELWCGDEQLWPPLGTDKEGRLAALTPGRSGRAPCEPEYGIVWDQQYGPAAKFLQQNFRDFNVVFFPWDWRKSPGASVERPRGQRRSDCEEPTHNPNVERARHRTCLEPLDDVINRIRAETGRREVVLWGHSAGGLVARWYVNARDRAKKVSRVLIAGTPFRGAPKALLPLAYGKTGDAIDRTIGALGLVSPLRELARKSPGTYHVLPSKAYGPFTARDRGDGRLAGETVEQGRRVVTAVGGNSALYSAAENDHTAHLDQLRPIGNVNLQVIAGRGVLTLHGFEVGLPDPGGPHHLYPIWGDGDGTAPIDSAEAGNLPLADEPTRVRNVGGVQVHEVCATHASLQGSTSESAYSGPVKDFLASGKPLSFPSEKCEPDGTAVSVESYGPLTTPAQRVMAQRASVRPAGSSGPAIPLGEAIRKRLVDAFDTGDELTITVSDRNPVTLALPQSRAAVRVTRVTAEGQGESQTYLSSAPGLSIATGPEPAVANRTGPIAPAAPDDVAPQTTVSVRRSGRRVIARARASDASGVTGTWYQLGRGRRHAWRGRLRLTLKQARRLRFYSVDTFDNVEKPKRLPLRR
jgi:hypothetical protein